MQFQSIVNRRKMKGIDKHCSRPALDTFLSNEKQGLRSENKKADSDKLSEVALTPKMKENLHWFWALKLCSRQTVCKARYSLRNS